MIKVLHLSKTLCAGVPKRLTDCLNKYSHGMVSSDFIILSSFGKNSKLGNLSYGEKKDNFYCLNSQHQRWLVQEADIIHLHHNINYKNIFSNVNFDKKKIIVHNHNWITETYNNIKYHIPLVVGQYQPRLYPDAYIVPNVIDIYDSLLMPSSVKNEVPKVFYSYSNSSEKNGSWSDKGARYIIPILKNLEGRGYIKAEIHTNTPYKELMSIKAKCDVCIDDIMTGSYHLTALEALSQGLLVINRLDEKTKIVMDYITKNHEYSRIKNGIFIYSDNSKLENKILELIEDINRLKWLKQLSRHFIEKSWHPSVLIEYYIDIYQAVIKNKKPELCKTFKEIS